QVSYLPHTKCFRSDNLCLIEVYYPSSFKNVVFRLFQSAKSVYNMISLLLLMSGDVEQNPGPKTVTELSAEMHNFFARLEEGQDKMLKAIQEVQVKQQENEDALTAINTKLSKIEQELPMLEEIKSDIEDLQAVTDANTSAINQLTRAQDDLENRSRRNNLVFFGIPDSEKETWAEAEAKVIAVASESLGVQLKADAIERAHRLGRYRTGADRPIIAHFENFKYKEAVLSRAFKLKGTRTSISEDFSQRVINIRKQLIGFAKSKNAKFSLRYDKLLMNGACFVIDDTTSSVRELS
ncbi:unnamed protein product, partial [Ixodes hexagonus]